MMGQKWAGGRMAEKSIKEKRLIQQKCNSDLRWRCRKQEIHAKGIRVICQCVRLLVDSVVRKVENSPCQGQREEC